MAQGVVRRMSAMGAKAEISFGLTSDAIMVVSNSFSALLPC
tara:strand:- start:1199 stop:1321 length:123 start_codon:yes stop_codon:yes gene_type:complete